MTYFVVSVSTPDQQIHTCVLLVCNNQNLREQLSEKFGEHFHILTVTVIR